MCLFPKNIPKDLSGIISLKDRDSFNLFYDYCGGGIFAIVTHIIKDRTLSEKIFAEIVIEVWNGLEPKLLKSPHRLSFHIVRKAKEITLQNLPAEYTIDIASGRESAAI